MMKMVNRIEKNIMNWELRKIKVVTVLVVLILGLGVKSQAQVAPEKYWIQFTDKDNSPYSITDPLVYLSQRAIDRRNAQAIAITTQDFPVNPAYVLGVEQTANVNVLISSRWLNGIVIQTTDTNGLSQIMNLPFVDSANSKNVELPFTGIKSTKMEVDGVKERVELPISNNPEGVLDYGYAETQNKMIHVDYLHDLGYTGAGMVIAVLDAGFYGSDTTTVVQNLFTNNQILGTWDFVEGKPVDYTRYSNHGAFVLNCMGAYSPGFYVGSAPAANYWLLRTEDAPTENIIEEYNWVAGAEFADSAGADVFNTSLGYTTFDDTNNSHTPGDLDGNTTVITIASDIAASKGILVINSAGNSGNNPWYYIGAPADGDSVLAIGAVSANRQVTSFSSRGPSADGRVKPNVMAMGGRVPMPIGVDTVFNINGTSFSGPILAGAAACLWQARSTYGNMEIFHAIEESADRFSNPNDDYGFGIPNMGMAYYIVTGLKEMEEHGLSVKAYPNPTNGAVYVPVMTNRKYQISISDVSGKLMDKFEATTINDSYQLDISTYKAGIYLINLISDQETVLVRVLKN